MSTRRAKVRASGWTAILVGASIAIVPGHIYSENSNSQQTNGDIQLRMFVLVHSK